MRAITLIAALAAAFIAQQASADEVHLVCGGDTAKTKTDMASINGYNGRGGYINGGARATHRKDQSDDVYVDIADGKGSIKLPPDMVPPINNHSDDGWRPFDALSVDADAISGKFTLNFANHPKVLISRVTGRIDIAALKMSFAGQCEPYDPKTVARKF